MHNRGTMAKSVAVLCHCYLFKARIQMVRPYNNLRYPVVVQTRPYNLNVLYCHQLFILQHYSAPLLVFRPYRRHTTCVL